MKRIQVCCTGKGDPLHGRVKIGDSYTFSGSVFNRHARNAKVRPELGGYRHGEVGRRRKNGGWVLTPLVRVHGEHTTDGEFDESKDFTYELLCPQCGRNPHIRSSKMRAALAALRDAGHAEIDISRLPF